MLDLSIVLSIDDKFSAVNTLHDCLGDSFLYANNPIFEYARDLAIQLGVRYVSGEDALSRDYFAAPLLVLQDLNHGDSVPYQRNRFVIQRVIDRNPEFRVSAEHLVGFLTHNHVLHESCHLIADRTLPALTEGQDKARVIVRSLLSESFANIIERLTLAFVGGTHIHRLFLALNCYTFYDPDPHFENMLRTQVALLGLRDLFRVGLVSFLHANMCTGRPSDTRIREWTDLILGPDRLSMAEWTLLAATIRSRFILPSQFRDGTTATFFRMLNCESEYRQMIDTELTEGLLRRFKIIEQVNLLSENLPTAK